MREGGREGGKKGGRGGREGGREGGRGSLVAGVHSQRSAHPRPHLWSATPTIHPLVARRPQFQAPPPADGPAVGQRCLFAQRPQSMPGVVSMHFYSFSVAPMSPARRLLRRTELGGGYCSATSRCRGNKVCEGFGLGVRTRVLRGGAVTTQFHWSDLDGTVRLAVRLWRGRGGVGEGACPVVGL